MDEIIISFMKAINSMPSILFVATIILIISGKLFHAAGQNAAPFTAGDLKNGLVLHYDFDAPPAGGKVHDLSGSGNDGQATGVRWLADGHRGGAMQFGLTNCYITVPNNDSLSATQFTLAVWIKTSYADWIWRRIMDKGWSNAFALSMCGEYPRGNGWRHGMFSLEEGGGGDVVSHVRVDDGKWHQVVAAFDGENIQLFVDGQVVRTGKSPRKKPLDPRFDLTLGANRSTPDPNWGEMDASFNGQMDDVMVYKRALSAGEVQFLYDSQKVQTDVALKIPAPQPRAPSPAQNKPSATDRLKQLESLYQQGLINKEDYERKKKEILDSL